MLAFNLFNLVKTASFVMVIRRSMFLAYLRSWCVCACPIVRRMKVNRMQWWIGSGIF